MSARASNKTAFSVPPGLVLPARSLLALALAAVFVWQLTKETNKYSEGKTTTTFTDEKADEQGLPIMTICPKTVFDKDKNNNYFHLDPLENKFIDWPPEGADVWDEWEKGTVKLTDVVKKVEVRHANEQTELVPDGVWSDPDGILRVKMVDSVFYGRCYSLEVGVNLTVEEQVHIDFVEGQCPGVFIHSPGQELELATNDWDSSTDFLKVKPGTVMTTSITKQVTVSRPKTDNCSASETEMGFTLCRLRWFKKKYPSLNNGTLGKCPPCSLPQRMDFRESANLPWCSNATAATCMVRKALNLMRLSKRERRTGCRRPCARTHYSAGKKELGLHQAKDRKDDRCRLTIKLATANTLIQEDYILFDFGAFVASVGGSMGLFLGLSFMDAVEWMKMLQRK